jgi:hypothetical protein
MQRVLASGITRRRFLAAGLSLAGVLALGNTRCDPAIMRRVRQAETRSHPRHAVWVWQFSIDGPPDEIISTLASYGLAAIVKTHDGVEWMATYDDAPGAIGGPADVAALAERFERGGVPFHAWAVVNGVDPLREAEMAAAVLEAGARSLTLDLEPGDGFWQGTADDALRFGYELRARQEFARIDVSIDPRPWKVLEIPLPEFASFTDGIRPQLYWDLFDDEHHVNAYEYFGFPPADTAITPEFLVDVARDVLTPFDRWIQPIGIGNPRDAGAWERFIQRCRERGMPEMSVWRYGPVSGDVLRLLAASPP